MYAVKYPKKPTFVTKTYAKKWYASMVAHLPCGECAKKYKALIECALPLTSDDLKSRDALFEWTVKLHNMVNVLLQKPVFELEDARRLYFY
jgi:hypothetical protein